MLCVLQKWDTKFRMWYPRATVLSLFVFFFVGLSGSILQLEYKLLGFRRREEAQQRLRVEMAAKQQELEEKRRFKAQPMRR